MVRSPQFLTQYFVGVLTVSCSISSHRMAAFKSYMENPLSFML